MRLSLVGLIGAGMMLSGCAGFYNADRYVEAQVLSVDKAPDRCEQKSNAAPIALGAIFGGLIGHQIGDGSGQKVATVAGVAAGAVAGEKMSRDDSYRCQSQGYIATVRYIHPHTGKHTLDKVMLDDYTDATSLMVPIQ